MGSLYHHRRRIIGWMVSTTAALLSLQPASTPEAIAFNGAVRLTLQVEQK